MSISTTPSGLMATADVLDAIAQPIYVKTANHQWTYVNPALAKLIGLSPDAVVGRSEVDFLPQSVAHQLREEDQRFLDQQLVNESSLSLGQRQWTSQRQLIEIDAQPALVNTLQDTTDLRQARKENETLNQALEINKANFNKAQRLESTLKRITDRVRDSLDEQQILQTAVDALVKTLNVKAANTALYDLEQETSTVYYECSAGLAPMRGRVSQMESYPEVYHQLLAGQYFQFCSIFPNPERGHVSMFAAPIRDDRGVLGDLWLINDKDNWLRGLDIRLVQQVTNQCAIAIRQARLYQESQSQVRELEHVNTLKDDFLSTVSHELRTPVTSMRVALQLLGVTLKKEYGLEEEDLNKPQAEQSRLARYFCILQEECEREISLINDLLDLQRLDVGNHPMLLHPIKLPEWLPSVVSGFKPRAISRQQTLSLEIAKDLPELVSDLASLERVLAELINNACKYTPPDHSIAVTVNHTPEKICIQVVNTGVEIDEEEQKRIFDKFYRVPSADPWKQGGTGLGLALSQKLVEHLEGDISVTSGQNQTAFTVELPIVHSAAPPQ